VAAPGRRRIGPAWSLRQRAPEYMLDLPAPVRVYLPRQAA